MRVAVGATAGVTVGATAGVVIGATVGRTGPKCGTAPAVLHRFNPALEGSSPARRQPEIHRVGP
jgi:hypothetical protein